LRFVTQFQISLDPEKREKLVEFVNAGLSSGALKPVIDRTFRLAEIVDAHRYLESNKHIGKIVIDLA
jgi:NADPH:quinone reductase-like Zn-dependent oxidoreductase